MLCVFYDPKTSLYRSNESREQFIKDINKAAIYRSYNNAKSFLNNEIKTWTRNEETWKKHPNYEIAVKQLAIWKRVKILEVTLLVLTNSPTIKF